MLKIFAKEKSILHQRPDDMDGQVSFYSLKQESLYLDATCSRFSRIIGVLLCRRTGGGRRFCV